MNCKNAAIIFLLFLAFSFAVLLIPAVTQFDNTCIKCVQECLSGINPQIPIMAGGIIFYIMTLFPIIAAGIYFLTKKMYRSMFLFAAVPFIAYFINSVIKAVVQRPRPPIEMQLQEHMSSSSYVSRHTFVTACLWGMFIYIVCKYCKNRIIKYFLVVLSAVWILFESFSRVWMGVHNPTDVIGALILASAFVIFYIRLVQKLS